MFRLLKNWIRRQATLYKLYTTIRYWKIARTRNWVARNLRFVAKHNLNPVVFYQGKAFFRVFDDCEFQYHPSILGGLLGMERENGFELQEIRHLLTRIKPNSVVLDIGANFGFYSVILAKKCVDIDIHCFEPVATTFDHLVANIEHNNVSASVTVNNVGVSERPGEVAITTDLYAGNYLAMSDSDRDTDIVEVVTVDQYVASKGIAKIDLIKCDIEGAELLMLRGAIHTIRRDFPIIFVEIFDDFCKRFDSRAEDVIRFLLGLGYSYKILTRDGREYLQTDDLAEDLNNGSDFLFSKT